MEIPKKSWAFNHSTSFLAFLRGDIDYDCTPWGNPTYNIFGWQKPCYLLGDGYVRTFKELIEDTEWERYGQKGTDERCKDCMVHCGYEASAVNDTFTIPGLARFVKSAFTFGRPAEYGPGELEQFEAMKADSSSSGESHSCASSQGGATASGSEKAQALAPSA